MAEYYDNLKGGAMKFVMLQAYVLLFCDWYLFHVPLPYLHQGIPYRIGGSDMTSSYSLMDNKD